MTFNSSDTENIVIIGSSGHARVIIDIVEQEGRYKIAGLIDSCRSKGEQTLGYCILGKEEDLPELQDRHGLKGILVAVGDNFIRSQIAGRIEKICPELAFVRAIHPKASIGKGVAIGEGSVIMAGAVVNACCSVGRFCILNTNCSLDHDSHMDDFSSLAPGVVTGGSCQIGRHSAISIGAALKHQIEIGEQTIIGAKSLVMKSVGPYVVAYGAPARIIRKRKAGDKYL